MAIPGLISLGAIRIQAQQRADMVNSNFVSVPEWNSYINSSFKELYDLLISAYGNDYYVAQPFQFTTDGTTYLYSLPEDFYKILGLDLLYTNTQGSNITIHRFNFNDRNRYAIPNFQSFYGVTNLRYRLRTDKLWLTPTPASGQILQILYIPQPTNLQAYFAGGLTSASAVVTVADTSLLQVGMSVAGATGIPANALISSISTNVSITLSVNATATLANQTLTAWNDATLIAAVSGWEEYIVVDAAIKAMQKEESDVTILVAQKLDLRQRLNDMMANRDAGFPQTVGDTQYNDFSWPNGSGGGYGSGAF